MRGWVVADKDGSQSRNKVQLLNLGRYLLFDVISELLAVKKYCCHALRLGLI